MPHPTSILQVVLELPRSPTSTYMNPWLELQPVPAQAKTTLSGGKFSTPPVPVHVGPHRGGTRHVENAVRVCLLGKLKHSVATTANG
jgi:hypothetical protein